MNPRIGVVIQRAALVTPAQRIGGAVFGREEGPRLVHGREFPQRPGLGTLGFYPEQVNKVYQSGLYMYVPMRREKRKDRGVASSTFMRAYHRGNARRVNVRPRVIIYQVWVREVAPTQFSCSVFSSCYYRDDPVDN